MSVPKDDDRGQSSEEAKQFCSAATADVSQTEQSTRAQTQPKFIRQSTVEMWKASGGACSVDYYLTEDKPDCVKNIWCSICCEHSTERNSQYVKGISNVKRESTEPQYFDLVPAINRWWIAGQKCLRI